MSRKPPSTSTADDFLTVKQAQAVMARRKVPTAAERALARSRIAAARGPVFDSGSIENETLSGRRMNAEGRAWLVVAGGTVDGDSGAVEFEDERGVVVVFLGQPRTGSRYLVQLLAMTGPSATQTTVLSRGDDVAISYHGAGARFVVPAIVTATRRRAMVVFVGMTASWWAYSVNIRRI